MMGTVIQETGCPLVKARDVLNGGSIQENLLIVDVRTPAEFEEVHIPGALNVPLSDLSRWMDEVKAKAKGKQVVVMCRTQNRAKLAHEQMVKAGVPDCHVMEGGISKWVEAKHLVVQGRKTISLERQVRIVAGGLIVSGAVLGFAFHPWWHILSGFVGAGLVHAGVTDSCMMGMLLARLPFNRRI